MNIDHIREAASVIQERLGGSATLGIVLGSGLGALADEVSDPVHIPYGEIPHFPTSSVVGHAGRLVAGKLEGVSVIMMQGRVHAYEGYETRASRLSSSCLTRLRRPRSHYHQCCRRAESRVSTRANHAD